MLATGIPRYRLPREVRDREVAAIEALGVDIKTGVTIGRDVSFSDLRERGYQAFFLAIGAHQNNELNIPGEDLEGVVDGMSLLFALNLRVGASVGSNVVVIGGGNSAVDSARAAKRRSKGVVRILCIWEEMTAVRDDVEEAIREGIAIEYRTAPVEILGDGAKVTGLRCQRMAMGEMGDWPEPIPGSEFVIDADHVVVAIGQRPNTSLLRLMRLETDGDNATIVANPLTLETNIPGIFAGGMRYHGVAPIVSALYRYGYIEAVAHKQREAFEAGLEFTRAEGLLLAPPSMYTLKEVVDEARRCKEEGASRTILFSVTASAEFDTSPYDPLLAGELEDESVAEDLLTRSLSHLPDG